MEAAAEAHVNVQSFAGICIMNQSIGEKNILIR